MTATTEPYATRDADGHEHLVLGATYTVLADIGHGQQTVVDETATYDEAVAVVARYAFAGVRTDIEVDLDTVDLTAAARQSPLDWLAVEWVDPDEIAGGWAT